MGDMLRINDFITWIDSRKEQLEHAEISVEQVVVSKTGDSVYAGNCSQSHIGRITFSESGYLDAEVLDINTGNITLYEHFEGSKLDFDVLLKRYLESMQEKAVI